MERVPGTRAGHRQATGETSDQVEEAKIYGSGSPSDPDNPHVERRKNFAGSGRHLTRARVERRKIYGFGSPSDPDNPQVERRKFYGFGSPSGPDNPRRKDPSASTNGVPGSGEGWGSPQGSLPGMLTVARSPLFVLDWGIPGSLIPHRGRGGTGLDGKRPPWLESVTVQGRLHPKVCAKGKGNWGGVHG